MPIFLLVLLFLFISSRAEQPPFSIKQHLSTVTRFSPLPFSSISRVFCCPVRCFSIYLRVFFFFFFFVQYIQFFARMIDDLIHRKHETQCACLIAVLNVNVSDWTIEMETQNSCVLKFVFISILECTREIDKKVSGWIDHPVFLFFFS